MADFDVNAARKAGYTDAEIADYLATQRGFDVNAARQSGYKDAEIVAHLVPPQSPGVAAGALAGTAGGYLGTQAARTAGGMASLPGTVAKGAEWAYRQLGLDPASIFGPQGAKVLGSMASDYPTADKISDAALDTVGMKPVNLEGSMPGGKILDTGVQGLMGTLATGGTSLPAMLAGTFGGAGSEIGGQLAEGTPYEIPARLAGAVVGGVGGAVTPSVVRKVADVVKGPVAPFTPAGQRRIAGEALRKSAADPDAAIANLERYTIGKESFPDAVPGFKIDAGKASRDPGLMVTAEIAKPARPAMGLQVQENNAAITRALDRLEAGGDPRAFVGALRQMDDAAASRAQAALDALPAGADAAIAGTAIRNALFTRHEALDAARSRATAPLYEAARSYPDDLHIGPVFRAADDLIANSKGDIQAAARKVRGLLFNSEGRPDWSANGMMNTRSEVADMLLKVQPGSNEQRILLRMKDAIENSLSSVPAERQARRTFAEMSRPLDPFSADRGAPNVAKVVETDRFGSNYLAPEKVPGMFFRPGDTGAATMNEFLAANAGNQTAIDAMKRFVADKAREAGDVKAFLLKNRQAIETLDPALARQLEDAAATKTISQGFKASPAGKFIDSDLDAAVRSTLGASDSTKRMQTLQMAVGGKPDAVAGLRRSVLDDFRRSASASVAEGATAGESVITAAGASRWLDKNRGAVANVLTPAQVGALDDIVRNLKDQAQTVPGRVGSPTFDRLASESILGAMVGKRFGDAPVLHPVRRALGLAYGGADEAVMNIIFDAIQDPRAAAALMKKATPGNVKLAEPLLQSIGRGTVAGTITQAGRE